MVPGGIYTEFTVQFTVLFIGPAYHRDDGRRRE